MTNFRPMYLRSLKNLKLVYLAIVFSTFCLFLMYNTVSLRSTHETYNRNDPLMQQMRVFSPVSNCSCKRPSLVVIPDLNFFGYVKVYELLGEISDENIRIRLLYKLTKDEYSKAMLMCNAYTSLRRGKNQKVIAYSLFGKHKGYYLKMRNLTKQIHRFYPDWFIRVYYDDTIDKSIICEHECLSVNDGQIIDNLDFCDANSIETNFEGNRMNAKYIRK